MARRVNVYKRLIEITNDYLGPAAERFIDRQIRSHLHKNPKDITKAELLLLVDWIRAAVSLLTNDREMVEEYLYKLQELGQDARKNDGHEENGDD